MVDEAQTSSRRGPVAAFAQVSARNLEVGDRGRRMTRTLLVQNPGSLSILLGAIAFGLLADLATASAGLSVTATALDSAFRPATSDLNSSAQSKKEPPVTQANPLWAVALEALTATRERPLFAPSRRPPQPKIVLAPPAPIIPQFRPPVPERPPLTLLGTIVSETQSFAVFADSSGKRFIRLKSGQQHTGWTLRTIGLREVTLEKDRQLVILVLPARNMRQSSAAIASLRGISGVSTDGPKPPWLDAAVNRPPQAAPVRQTEQGDSISAAAPKPPWLNPAVNPPLQAAPVRQTEEGLDRIPAAAPKPPWMNAAANPPPPIAASPPQIEQSDVNIETDPKPPWLSAVSNPR